MARIGAGSTAVLVTTLFCAPESAAQAIAPVVGRELPAARAWAGLGWDPTFTLDAGGSLAVFRSPHRWKIMADVGFRAPVVLLPAFDAWQLAVGATGVWTSTGGFGVTLGLHPDVRVAHDTSGTKIALGAALGARPGYYGRRFGVALDALWATSFATHMSHSDAVKDTFRERYPDGHDAGHPRDGFYAFTSHRFRLGVAGGAALRRSVALHGACGLAYTPQVNGILANPPMSPMPFYAEAGGAYRW